MMSRKERMLLLTGRWGSDNDDVERGVSIMNAHMGIDLPRDRLLVQGESAQ
jgi:hypothetical protein